MFKGHPKGLIIASLANMGERFGFYTMMAILLFFLQARYGMTVAESGDVYSWFYFGIYALALFGGIIADKYTGLGRTVLVGIITMLAGYVLLSFPIDNKTVTYGALFVIALGNGMFKGNLQALVGNLYESAAYSKLRDAAFSIFYMCINIGAFFAPSAAEAMLNYVLKSSNFIYEGKLPALCHQYLNGGEGLNIEEFQSLAQKATLNGAPVTDLRMFAEQYINEVSIGYHYAFGIAALAMVISLLCFTIYRKYLKPGDFNSKSPQSQHMEKISPAETKKRLIALGMVFFVVIFFWMAFHQNGVSLNQFAKDYTQNQVTPFTNMFFNLGAFLSVIAFIGGVIFLITKKGKMRLWGAVFTLAGALASMLFYTNFDPENAISPLKFQQFNPVFIVFLTPVVVWIFSKMREKDREPSAPRKIGYGMIIASMGFMIMIGASVGLISPCMGGVSANDLVSPYWLISTYFTLTIAELCLSPMGISFVSKVAPPQYKGLMQGCWLAATAVGNKLVAVGSYFWERLELWQLWSIFVVCCLASAIIIFSLMRRLEAVAK